MKKIIKYIFIIIVLLCITFKIKNLSSYKTKPQDQEKPMYLYYGDQGFLNNSLDYIATQNNNLEYPLLDLTIPALGYYSFFTVIEGMIDNIDYKNSSKRGWKRIAAKIGLTLLGLYFKPNFNFINGRNFFNRTAQPYYLMNESQQSFLKGLNKINIHNPDERQNLLQLIKDRREEMESLEQDIITASKR